MVKTFQMAKTMDNTSITEADNNKTPAPTQCIILNKDPIIKIMH